MRHKQTGTTLIELMVAFGLSAILMLGIYQVFTSSKQAFNLQGGVSNLQESGRIAMEFVGREIRNAGYMGCATGGFSGNFSNLVNPAQYTNSEVRQAITLLDGDNGIVGFDNITNIANGSILDQFNLVIGTDNGQIVAGTDVMVLHSVDSCLGGKVTAGGTGTTNISIQNAANCNLKQKDVVIISNCTTAEAFAITNADVATTDVLQHGGAFNTSASFTGTYVTDSSIYTLSSRVFYLANTAAGPSVFMKLLNDETVAIDAYINHELANNVENQQFLYGEDTSGDGSVNRYLSAETPGLNMNRVIAIKASFLVRSEDRLLTTNQTYSYIGSEQLAADFRMRAEYQSTNAIRNRLN